MVWQLAGKTKLPLIGMGGIMTAEDAIEFMIVGASAVQVGTANFRDPSATMSVLDGMEAYFKRHRLAGVEDIVGTFDTTPRQ
jgi:dihydroorotate dehydrogenase (NAD+) catalytic subunit